MARKIAVWDGVAFSEMDPDEAKKEAAAGRVQIAEREDAFSLKPREKLTPRRKRGRPPGPRTKPKPAPEAVAPATDDKAMGSNGGDAGTYQTRDLTAG